MRRSVDVAAVVSRVGHSDVSPPLGWSAASQRSAAADRRETNILVLPRYSRIGASSRIRFLQYIDTLERDRPGAYKFTVSPLLGDEYISKLYSENRRNPWYLVRQYASRLRVLLSSHSYDGLWIEKELFPGAPATVERLLALLGVPMVVDYDDATFVYYKFNSNRLMRSLLGNKIAKVIRCASVVTAGNQFLASHAKEAGAKAVVLLPTAVETTKYLPAMVGGSAVTPLTVGWIGSPSTARYLSVYAEALATVQRRHGTRVQLIGAPGFTLDGVEAEALPWSEATEHTQLQQWHVALGPLEAGPWEEGKCSFKVLQCMAAGLPVIASPIGVNRDIIEHGVNGFLASNSSECEAILERLAVDPDLRVQVGAAARLTVLRRYNVNVIAPQLANVLQHAFASGLVARTRMAPHFKGDRQPFGSAHIAVDK